MKSFVAAGLLALSLAPLASVGARADDFGAAVARDAVRGALGEPPYRDRYRDEDRDYRRDRYYRDRYEGRSDYRGDNCRTITVERDDGSVMRKRRCD